MLPYNGKSLIGHATDAANEADASPVIVVLGAHASELEKEIEEKKLHVVVNKAWEEGMASSIRCGMETLSHIAPASEAAILMVCDQPHVSASILNELIRTQKETGNAIVACQYGDAIGPPALFTRSLFPELLKLKGDAGARKIVEKHSEERTTIPFDLGRIDIDTEEDYRSLSLST